MHLPKALRSFLVQHFSWVALCAAVVAICRFPLGLRYPYRTPLFERSENFHDFSSFYVRFHFFHRLAFFDQPPPFMYPAPVAVLYKIFFLGEHGASSWPATFRLLFVISAITLVFVVMLATAMARAGLSWIVSLPYLVCVLLLSYPLWFELSRANIEFSIWFLISTGVYFFCRDRPWISAALFGIAAAMKLFPFVFFCLLLSRKEYRQILFGIVVAVLVTWGSLWLLYPDLHVSAHYTLLGLHTFQQMYMLHIRPQEIGFDHSLFALIKRSFPVLPSPASLAKVLRVYLAIAALGGIALYLTRIRKLPIVNQVTCLTICSILLPPTSYDYTLLHLYAPWAMLMLLVLDAARTQATLRHYAALTFSVACYAMLLSPQTEFIFRGERFGGQMKAVVLVALLYTALRYPLEVVKSPSTNFGQSTLETAPV